MNGQLEALLILAQGRLVVANITSEQEVAYWSELNFADAAKELEEKLKARTTYSEPIDVHEQKMLADLHKLEVSIAKAPTEQWADALDRVAKSSVATEVAGFSTALAAALRWR
ncbi:MAG TPA: hypothetical protein VF759_09065 [Allosphingosinicella sp.]